MFLQETFTGGYIDCVALSWLPYENLCLEMIA